MFSIEKKTFGTFEIHSIKNVETGEYVEVIPGYGANLHKLVLSKGGKCRSILKSADTYEAFVSGAASHEGCKLAPWAGRVNNGKYAFEGKSYALSINDPNGHHAMHGLVYNKPFALIAESYTAESGRLEYSYQLNEAEGYPFSFLITISFELNHQGLSCVTRVNNTGSTSLPYCDGWHPYFLIDCPVEEAFLTIPSKKTIVHDDLMVPTGEFEERPEFYEGTNIGDQRIDDCFCVENTGDRVVTSLHDPVNHYSIELWQDSGERKYNFVVVYVPDSRDCVALEPLSGLPDTFNNQVGLIILKEKEEITLSMGINIK